MDIRWEGNVRDLVTAVASSDARTTYIDAKTGAKISINIGGGDFLETDEPFYIESPDGENLYDAYNRKDAVMILSNIRKGKKFPDMPDSEPKRKSVKTKSKKKGKKSSSPSTSLRMMR